MLNKTRTLYGHYLDSCKNNPLTLIEFLRLPYHERLRLSGCKIFLKRSPCCSALVNYQLFESIELPVFPHEMSEFRKDDVYLIGNDSESYPVYPFEYVIIYPNAEIKAGNLIGVAERV